MAADGRALPDAVPVGISFFFSLVVRHTDAVPRLRVSSGTSWETLAGFSRGMRAGTRVCISGTTATASDGTCVGGTDVVAQTTFALDIIEASLKSLGATLADVVRTRIFVRNVDDWEAAARAHGARFGQVKPANTLVEAKLVGDEYLVEIEAEVCTPWVEPMV